MFGRASSCFSARESVSRSDLVRVSVNCSSPLSRAAFNLRITARPAVGQADALHAAVGAVLVAKDETAADEVVDHPARRGQRNDDEFCRLLQRQLTIGVLEVVQELDLGERQLQRSNSLEQVRVAVLVQEDDQRIQIGPEVGDGRWLVGINRVTCTHASIAHNLCLCKRN